MVFRLLLGIDALVGAVIVWFFLLGLDDGGVSESNIALWLIILFGLGGVMLGGLVLRAQGRDGAARLLLGVIAGPALLVGLFFLLLILLNPRWN
jgi:hypothetical protein